MSLFKKSSIVGISLTPEAGVEVVEVDYFSKRILKYASRKIEYNSAVGDIADFDILKESLQDIFMELQIPKGTYISVSLNTPIFGINDFSASLDDLQLSGLVEDTLLSSPIFQNEEACYSKVILPNSTIQTNKVAYIAAKKNVIYELCYMLKDIGYKLYSIDSSINTLVNALKYLGKVDVSGDTSWVMIVVDSNICRVALMIGEDYSDIFEEKISIGEVLGDDENYATVVSTVNLILKNIPAKYLCIVSRTSVIDAEKLAKKINYASQIICINDNSLSTESYMDYESSIDAAAAITVSMGVIGAAIARDFYPFSRSRLNLYNRSLGEIFLMEQPPEFKIGNKTIVFSTALLIKYFIILLMLVGIPVTIVYFYLNNSLQSIQQQLDLKNKELQDISKFLKENETISSELFDEGDQIRTGLTYNKFIYSNYTIIGTEIPKKLWLTYLKLNDKFTIEGQADNLESIYAFFRSIKGYNPEAGITLQKLGLAAANKSTVEGYDTDSVLTSMNADYYEFRISNEAPLIDTSAVTGDDKDSIQKNDTN